MKARPVQPTLDGGDWDPLSDAWRGEVEAQENAELGDAQLHSEGISLDQAQSLVFNTMARVGEVATKVDGNVLFLARRVFQDLRACERLLRFGYHVQAITVIRDALESSALALLLTLDERWAEEFPARAKVGPREVRKALKLSPSVDASLVEETNTTYALLCSITHPNVRALDHFGTTPRLPQDLSQDPLLLPELGRRMMGTAAITAQMIGDALATYLGARDRQQIGEARYVITRVASVLMKSKPRPSTSSG